ncbi:MAG: MFS transporter [Acidimicrobiales bacterium]
MSTSREAPSTAAGAEQDDAGGGGSNGVEPVKSASGTHLGNGSYKGEKAAFWGWRVVFAGAFSQMLLSGLIQHAYTNYSVLLREEFGWSTTLIAFGFAMNRLESGLLGPIQGWMIDHFGPRFVMRIGAIVVWVGLMLFSTLQNATQFFIYYLIVAMGASLAGFITIVTAVVNWFERRRSVALAAAQAGFPLGGVLTPLVVLSLTEFGWRQTAFWSAWIVLFLVVGLAQVMYKNPAAVGQEVDGGSPGEPGPNHEADAVGPSARRRSPDAVGRLRDFTLAEAVRTRAFWMLNFGHATALLVVGSTMAHLSIYLTEEQGFSLATAGWLGTSLLLTQLLGQVMGGWLGDRYSKRLLVIAAMVGHVIGMILFTFPTSTWMIWAFIPFHGLAWGVRGPLLQAIRADYFGASSFGRIMGWSALIMMLGTMSGPIIVGLLRDSTGSYTAGFTVITIGASLAVGFFFLATKPALPDEPATA